MAKWKDRRLLNILFTTAAIREVRFEDVSAFCMLLGDVNGDGRVSIFDAVQIVNYNLENNPDPFFFSAADIYGNGQITIFDAVSVVNIIQTQSSSNNVKEMLIIDELDPK